LKRSETLYEALKAAQWPKSEREMVLVFHQNGRSTVSARLIAPGSRLVGFGPDRGVVGGDTTGKDTTRSLCTFKGIYRLLKTILNKSQ